MDHAETAPQAKSPFPLLWIVCVVLLVSGVLYGASWWKRTQLRAGVLATLKDPDSALFRSEHVEDGELCGEVNAKNSMGGYVGYKKFVTSPVNTFVEGSTEDTFFKAYWTASCEK